MFAPLFFNTIVTSAVYIELFQVFVNQLNEKKLRRDF